jgi:uncharacterized protein (TIGR00369 family)
MARLPAKLLRCPGDAGAMERLPLHHLAEGLRCFVCGPQNPHSLGVRFELAGDMVEARWTASPKVEGWPGLLHGAAFGALHDEAAAWAMIALACKTGFTTHMDVRFLKPLRVGDDLVIRAKPEQVGDRNGTFASEVLLPDGSLASTARTTYAFLDEATITRLLGTPVSPQLRAWLAADAAGRRKMLETFGRAV